MISDAAKAQLAHNLLSEAWFKAELEALERIAVEQALWTSPANDIGRMEFLAEVKAYRKVLAHLETLANTAISEEA